MKKIIVIRLSLIVILNSSRKKILEIGFSFLGKKVATLFPKE